MIPEKLIKEENRKRNVYRKGYKRRTPAKIGSMRVGGEGRAEGRRRREG